MFKVLDPQQSKVAAPVTSTAPQRKKEFVVRCGEYDVKKEDLFLPSQESGVEEIYFHPQVWCGLVWCGLVVYSMLRYAMLSFDLLWFRVVWSMPSSLVRPEDRQEQPGHREDEGELPLPEAYRANLPSKV